MTMHPSKRIIGTKASALKGRKIVLGICGSVAASLCPVLARELMRRGAEVRVVMTPNACRLISPELMHWATGEKVVTELTGEVEHLQLSEWADLILVAPCTANTLSKLACGIDDTPVTSVLSVALGLGKPIVLVPAMDASMYRNPAVQSNLKRLGELGVQVMEPRMEEGKAKFPDPQQIADFVEGMLEPRDMEGMRVIVTAGPTVEHLDPIKILTNRSSGKMGIALAEEARRRGAEVVLIYGPGTEEPPEGIRVIRVESTAEMKQKTEEEMSKGADFVFFAAAPQDFTFERTFEKKLRWGTDDRGEARSCPEGCGEGEGAPTEGGLGGFQGRARGDGRGAGSRREGEARGGFRPCGGKRCFEGRDGLRLRRGRPDFSLRREENVGEQEGAGEGHS
jgi:phosphopantothenoylcysteine decarboxylase/phosphopantothenate--cysteine ligase